MIKTLKHKFLSSPLRRGEREPNQWYSPAMLLRRERCWRDERVQNALQNAWLAISRCVCKQPASEAFVTWHAYWELSRKLYLLLVQRTDFQEAHDLAVRDWDRDTLGQDPGHPVGLDNRAFRKSWFELADVYTTTIDEEAYVAFVDGLVEKLVAADEASGEARLRSDFDIITAVDRERQRQGRPSMSMDANRPVAAYERPTVSSRLRLETPPATPASLDRPHLSPAAAPRNPPPASALRTRASTASTGVYRTKSLPPLELARENSSPAIALQSSGKQPPSAPTSAIASFRRPVTTGKHRSRRASTGTVTTTPSSFAVASAESGPRADQAQSLSDAPTTRPSPLTSVRASPHQSALPSPRGASALSILGKGPPRPAAHKASLPTIRPQRGSIGAVS